MQLFEILFDFYDVCFTILFYQALLIFAKQKSEPARQKEDTARI